MSLELLSLDNIQEFASQYGYWAVFIGIALENMGIPIPGETITIVGGFLAGSGELNYWLVLASAIAGAVFGDNLGYWIGRSGGWQFLLQLGRFFNIHEHQLEKARKQFGLNAPRAVFFGRFVTLLRIFAGPMAGIAQMPYSQFLLCNFGGAAIWASIMVTLSFFCGRLIPLHQLVHGITQFGILALLLVVAWVTVTYWRGSRKLKQQAGG
ncbi:putative membrane-associated protein [Pleurocapsa sp. PCC 7327]|uniref:DedA family protein n=1 Tax=Pleurocapsa sp. PCC 7327 TaxID=118163 RepID=UPI00029FBFB3|nr:DedA family protein [Pleurocapsa sp. PCC 7327]AFY75651.1 putative membrane-associated protein [Pleurocapsa sp. PCC 7327]